jgi:hypothetical protein
MYGKACAILAVVGLATATTPVPSVAATGQHARAVARDGPFGILMGEPLSDLGPVRKTDSGDYEVLAPPKPNPAFSFVFVKAFPGLGVCMIIAVGPPRNFDTDGIVARQDLDGIAETLSQKYGAYAAKKDFCDDSQESCSRYWVAEDHDGKAMYAYHWDLSASPRADGVAHIFLDVAATNSVTTTARLQYRSRDDDKCDAAEKAAQGASL